MAEVAGTVADDLELRYAQDRRQVGIGAFQDKA
jgi:hypothetical protein